MWQLTMYCHWSPPDVVPLLTENVFGARDISDLISMVSFFHSLCGAALFDSHQGHLSPSVWQSLVGLRLLTSVRNAWQRSCRTQKSQRLHVNSGPILTLLWTKFHEILRQCRRPLVLPLPDCLLHISFRRYSPLSLEVAENRTHVKVFWPQLFGGETPNFSTAGCWHDSLSTAWQSLVDFRLAISVCEAWQWSRKQNLRRVGKNAGWVLRRLLTKVYDILRRRRRPLVVSSALPDCLCHVTSRRYRPLNLPLSCEVVEKTWFLGTRFVAGGYTPDFGHAFQIALTSEHVAGFGLVPFSEHEKWLTKRRRRRRIRCKT